MLSQGRLPHKEAPRSMTSCLGTPKPVAENGAARCQCNVGWVGQQTHEFETGRSKKQAMSFLICPYAHHFIQKDGTEPERVRELRNSGAKAHMPSGKSNKSDIHGEVRAALTLTGHSCISTSLQIRSFREPGASFMGLLTY